MKIRTLIADDDSESRNRLFNILKDFDDIEVIGEAINGDDEIEKIKELKPELVFTDNQMPYYNGTEVIEKIRMEFIENIPTFVIITADRYLHCDNAFSIINKPADRKNIEEVLLEYNILRSF